MPDAAAGMEVIRPSGGRRRTPAQAVIFDGDDTLWVTQWLYDQAEQATRLIVESAGLDGEQWLAVYKQRDVANIARFGFGPGRLRTTLFGAYSQLCEESGVPARLDILTKLVAVTEEIFRREAYLVADAEDVLRTLRPGHQLVLVTKGDSLVQHKRIRDSGLKRLFDLIVIVPDKSPAVFAAACAEVGADPSRSWSVGNSLPSDIGPAMAAGLRGVWIEAHVWDYEKRDPGTLAGVAKLARLHDLPELIARVLKGVAGPGQHHEGVA